MPDKNYSNPSQEAKHQKDIPTHYFINLSALVGQKDTIKDVPRNYPWDRRSCHPLVLFRTTQLFQELYLSWCCTNFQKFQYISNKFPNYFQPNHKSSNTVEYFQNKLLTRVKWLAFCQPQSRIFGQQWVLKSVNLVLSPTRQSEVR